MRPDPGHLGLQGYSIYITNLAIFSLQSPSGKRAKKRIKGVVGRMPEESRKGPEVRDDAKGVEQNKWALNDCPTTKEEEGQR